MVHTTGLLLLLPEVLPVLRPEAVMEPITEHPASSLPPEAVPVFHASLLTEYQGSHLMNHHVSPIRIQSHVRALIQDCHDRVLHLTYPVSPALFQAHAQAEDSVAECPAAECPVVECQVAECQAVAAAVAAVEEGSEYLLSDSVTV